MGLIYLRSDQIKIEDLYLSFNLTATRASYPTQEFSYTGKKEFEIGMYQDGKSFGITSIEIDTSLNMQPQVEITFKDLYGNLVFRPGNNSDYSKIFELPPAKFKLTFKGYLGKPVTYNLQLRSTSVNYVTSDGSFEIKAKFVPNIFGFFGDIPYKYLFSVDRLKELRGSSASPNSMLNIYKNGNTLTEKVETASEQFTDLKNQLNALRTGGDTLHEAVKAGSFSSDKKTAYKVDNISPTDANLTNAGFQPITIKFTNLKNGVYLVAPSGLTGVYGDAVKNSVVTNTPTIGANGVDVTIGTWQTQTTDLANKATDINSLIDANLTAIDKASQRSAGSQVQQEVIDSQTIGNVMSSLAGESAYVLGYILEGALNGYTPDRENNTEIVGVYYPLAYKENSTDGTGGQVLYDQVPWDEARTEMKYVQDFMKAQYEGQQQLTKYKDELEAQQNGTEGAQSEGSQLVKRITNAEAFKPNVYIPDNPDNVITKLIQRAGIVNTRFSGQIGADDNTSTARNSIVTGEYENIKKRITAFRGLDKESIRNFATRITKFYDATGKRLVDWDAQAESGSTTTYRQYFQTFFNSMKQGGLDDKMFANGNSSSLACNYFINNGVLYHNEKSIANYAGMGNVFFYITSDKATITSTVTTGTGEISETLNGGANDTTAPYESTFFQFLKTDGVNLGTPDKPSVIIDYDKLTSGSYNKVEDIFIKMAKTAGPNVVVPAEGSFFSRLAALGDADEKNLRTFVVNMNDGPMMATLHSWCTSILKDTDISDSAADQKKAEEDKKNATQNQDGTASPEGQTYEPYTFSQSVYDAVYHQFHHIANAWLSMLKDSLGNTDAKGIASSKKLAEDLEAAYLNPTSNEDRPYSITYTYAMQSSSVSNDTLKKAIVNTTLLGETDTESTVFSTMSNLGQQNNFLLQSVPGGFKSDGSGIDVSALFSPSFEKGGMAGNSLCFIWQPTPESRSLNNKNEFLYGDTKKLIEGIGKLAGDIPVFEFGSPDNIFVKSVKATTDDNKVTGESIAAVEDIINPGNQTKRRAFDCSMLSVMQGRSYKISLEILGNANFTPTQRFAIANIPIFSGLYWTSNVKHSITPNDMQTTIEAIKLKYDGGDKFIGVPPITTANYKGDAIVVNGGTGSSGGGTSGGENILTDGLNYEFIQKVKNEKMRNASEINAFIKKYTDGKYTDYPTWFNTVIKGKTFCGSPVVSKDWTSVWNLIIPVVWNEYGTGGINFLEFLCLDMIMYNETSGTYRPISEFVNGITNKTRPGIAYTFDQIPDKKKTYNQAPNIQAGVLFSDAKFISRFGTLKFGDDPNVLKSKNDKWNGPSFPKELFPNNIQEAADPINPTFINQADFFKFRGRGLIQTTWRGGYKRLVNYILSYTGNDAVIQKWKGLFKKPPYGGDPETILTVSSNQDWDEIFQTSTDLPPKAIQLHADNANKYQYFKDLTKSRQQLEEKVAYVAYRVSGTKGEYVTIFQKRVYQILDALSPNTKVTNTNTNNTESGQGSSYTPPPPPAASTPQQVAALKNALQKLYASTKGIEGPKRAGAGEEGLCGVYTVTAAKSYVTLLKDPNAKVDIGAYNRGRGHAKSDSTRTYLTSIGYTVNKVGSNLTKNDLIAKLRSIEWGLGDIAIYWATDLKNGVDGHTTYGHIQIFQGKQFNSNRWSTSVPDNYAKGSNLDFVYGRRKNDQWQLYVCRAPTA